MEITETEIDGLWFATPKAFADSRGSFHEWFRPDLLEAVAGRSFPVLQANESISRRGVVRGIHFADVPPGQAKWVHCSRGAVLDVIVDIRVGSPTFGAVVRRRLDDQEHHSVVIGEGLGHGFCALTDDATVSYLLTSAYDPAAEHGINPLDPALGIEWPIAAAELILSGKDADAPSLAAAQAAGLLPVWP